jgi:hypothetical protein
MEAEIAWDSDTIRPMKTESERLFMNDEWTFHPRTCELIHNCSSSKMPNPFKKRKHLACYPCTPHNQLRNASVGQKFDSKAHVVLWLLGNDTIKPQMSLGEPTHQCKTVWFSKHMRRQ